MWELQEFIVSGQVPGTSIQFTFEDWLVAMVAFVATLLIARAVRKQLTRKLRLGLLSLYAAFVIKTSHSNHLRLQA